MSEETPLARQWLVLGGLCVKRQGVSVREMADEMGVSQKTIRKMAVVYEKVSKQAVLQRGNDAGRPS